MDSELEKKLNNMTESLTGFPGALFKTEKNERKQIADLKDVTVIEYEPIIRGIIVDGYGSAPSFDVRIADEMELTYKNKKKMKLEELTFFDSKESIENYEKNIKNHESNKIENIPFTAKKWEIK